MKGILLCGGTGSRLFPSTIGVNKHLLTVFDKPMIYYSLSVLMLSNIRSVAIVCSERDLPAYRSLFGDGEALGMYLVYHIQKEPKGIAQSFIICSDFIGDSTVALALGDNLFWGHGLSELFVQASSITLGARVFAKQVSNSRSYGVVEFDAQRKAISIEEKPDIPKSNYAVTGLYYYDNTVVARAKSLVPSFRGELEVTDLNLQYLEEGTLDVELLGRGAAWLDTGTPEAMLDASNFVRGIQGHNGYTVACIEEIAFRNGWIGHDEVRATIARYGKTAYAQYLARVLSDG